MDSTNETKIGLSGGEIAGIVIGIFSLIVAIFFGIKQCCHNKSQSDLTETTAAINAAMALRKITKDNKEAEEREEQGNQIIELSIMESRSQTFYYIEDDDAITIPYRRNY